VRGWVDGAEERPIVSTLEWFVALGETTRGLHLVGLL
jgi:hypothetical protein